MNNLQQEIIIKFRKEFVEQAGTEATGWRYQMMGHPANVEAFLKESLETVHLSTRQEIAEELSKLPFHAEIEKITTWQRIKIAFTPKIVLIFWFFSIVFAYIIWFLITNLFLVNDKYPVACVGIMRESKNCAQCLGTLISIPKIVKVTKVKDENKCFK